MFIDKIDDKIVVELNDFDIEKTDIEFGPSFFIDRLIVPKKYELKTNLLLSGIENIVNKIEYK
jgi:hypothetical protein